MSASIDLSTADRTENITLEKVMETGAIAIAQLVASISLVGVTVMYWWETFQHRRDSRAPHVVVYTDHQDHRPTLIQIVIRNVVTVARPEGNAGRAAGLRSTSVGTGE